MSMNLWVDDGGTGWSPRSALQRIGQINWLVDGVIPQASICWLVAPPQSYKTFVALDMAAAIANGQQWHGRQTERAIVLYVAAEGGDDIQLRRAVIDSARGMPSPMRIIQARPRIDDSQGKELLAAHLTLSSGVYWDDGNSKSDAPIHEWLLRKLGDALLAKLTEEEQEDFPSGVDCFSMLTAVPHSVTPSSEGIYDPSRDREIQRWRNKLRPRLSAHNSELYQMWQQDAFGEASRTYLSSLLEAKHGIQNAGDQYAEDPCYLEKCPLLLIVDTYSQTAQDDDKRTVASYIKHLRDLIEMTGNRLSVIVIDHTTKAGNTYMGSGAKEGDVDVMLSVTASGKLVRIECDKMKAAKLFDPINLEMKSRDLEGFTDAQGRTLSSLYPVSGDRAHKHAAAAGGGTTAAAVILQLIDEAGGTIAANTLRDQFIEKQVNEGKKPDSVGRTYRRVIGSLLEDEVLNEGNNDTLVLAEA